VEIANFKKTFKLKAELPAPSQKHHINHMYSKNLPHEFQNSAKKVLKNVLQVKWDENKQPEESLQSKD